MKNYYKSEHLDIDEFNVIKSIFINKRSNQRQLSNSLHISLGKINKIINILREKDYLTANSSISLKAKKCISHCYPQRATILAAGYGLRMVPINTEEPKGLLEVKNEPIIERIIKQLHEVGITDISIVVGFMKEHYE